MVVIYRESAVNPVLESYLYEFLASVLMMGALYFFAGFFYEKIRVRCFQTVALVSVYLILVSKLGDVLYQLTGGQMEVIKDSFSSVISFIAVAMFLIANAINIENTGSRQRER